MLLPMIGVVGEIPAASFICLILGLLRMPLSASAPLVFFFSFFFFCFVLESYHWNICILHNDTWLVILQGQHREVLDISEVQADSQM